MLDNARLNLARDIPMFLPEGEGLDMCIVGGGPSLSAVLPKLRMRYQRGAKIWALNGSHDWLMDHAIIPDAMVLLDAQPSTAQFVSRSSRIPVYYVAAQCDPSVFDALDGRKVRMWVGYVEGMDAVVRDVEGKPIVIVGGGNTVGLKAMAMAALCRFRNIHLFGFDSCYGESHHAYSQAQNDGEAVMQIKAGNREFTCSGWMARQAMDFQTDLSNTEAAGCKVHVHGDGLIPTIAKIMKQAKENSHV